MAQKKSSRTRAGSRAKSSKAKKASDGTWFGRTARRIGGDGPWWQVSLRWFAVLSVGGLLLGALTFFILYRMIAIPDANADFKAQTTKVYYSDGKHQIGNFATQDRESISIDDIPASMQAAAIAAEDRSFYDNNGIDIKGIIRAARNNAASGEITGGGSTITQQYVKILYLTQERSYTRKVKEAILSIKIHNQLSKEEILEGYLNTIYFGNGAYGVEVAAKTYFGVPASKLNVRQSAALATIINSPAFYDPYAEGSEDRLLSRYNYVIDGMLKSGAITSKQAGKFTDNLPKFAPKKVSTRYSGSKGYLMRLVEDSLQNDLGFSRSQIDGGGLRVITTFDYDMQLAAIESAKTYRPDDLRDIHSALVSVEPGTGAVKSMYGGRDFLKSELNWATLGTQPGSTFKAFAVIAALENGYSLETELNGDSPLEFGEDVIENQGDSGGSSFGKVSLEKATEKSINTAFVDLVDQMSGGPTETLKAAQAAGIPKSVIEPVKDAGAPLVTPLGYFPVAPVDMANAYATLAAGGERAEWYVIEKVTGTESPYEHEVETERTIPEDVAADTVSAMQKVVSAGTGINGRTICPTAGKTGTATAGTNADQYVSSSWFVGFTPKLATAVMFNRGKGNEQLDGYLPTFYGGQYPAMTFKLFMDRVLDSADCGTFPPKAGIKATKGTIYKPPPPKCSSTEELNSSKTACVKKPPPNCKADEQLNSSKTACIKKPVQKPCGEFEQPDGNLGCEPVDVCPEGTVGTPPDCEPEPTCDDNPATPLPDCPPAEESLAWITLPLLAYALPRRRRDEELAA